MNNEIVASLCFEKNVTGNITSSLKGLIRDKLNMYQIPIDVHYTHSVQRKHEWTYEVPPYHTHLPIVSNDFPTGYNLPHNSSVTVSPSVTSSSSWAGRVSMLDNVPPDDRLLLVLCADDNEELLDELWPFWLMFTVWKTKNRTIFS